MLEVGVTSTELVEPTLEVLKNVNVFSKIKQFKSFIKCKPSDMYKIKYHTLCVKYLFGVIGSKYYCFKYLLLFYPHIPSKIYINSILII